MGILSTSTSWSKPAGEGSGVAEGDLDSADRRLLTEVGANTRRWLSD